MKSPPFYYAFFDLAADKVQLFIGCFGFTDTLLVPDGEQKEVADIVGHIEMLCINHMLFTAGQQPGKGPGAIAGEHHLSAQYNQRTALDSLFVFVHKFPHNTGDTGGINRITDSQRGGF